MANPRAKKALKIGITRDLGWLYFLRGNEVWRCPLRRAQGELHARPNSNGQELVARTALVRKPDHLYFLDSSGDISCMKKLSSAPKRTSKRND